MVIYLAKRRIRYVYQSRIFVQETKSQNDAVVVTYMWLGLYDISTIHMSYRKLRIVSKLFGALFTSLETQRNTKKEY